MSTSPGQNSSENHSNETTKVSQDNKNQSASSNADFSSFAFINSQTQQKKEVLKLLKLAVDQLDQLDPKQALNILESVEKKFIGQDKKPSDIWAQWKYAKITAEVMIDANLQKYKQEYFDLMKTVKQINGFISYRSQIQDMLQIIKNTILSQQTSKYQLSQKDNQSERKVFPYFQLFCDQNQKQITFFQGCQFKTLKYYLEFGLAKKQNLKRNDQLNQQNFYCLYKFYPICKSHKQKHFNQKHFTNIFYFTENTKFQRLTNSRSKALRRFTAITIQYDYQSIQFIGNSDWPSLKYIKFQGNKSYQAFQYMAQAIARAWWPEVQIVCFQNVSAQHLSCQHLAKARWSQLLQLNLSTNNISNLGCKYLTRGHWPRLTKLDLSDNMITQQGFKHIRKGFWPNLEILSLFKNTMGIQGARHLSKGFFQQLKQLNVRSNTPYEASIKLLLGNWLPEIDISCSKRLIRLQQFQYPFKYYAPFDQKQKKQIKQSRRDDQRIKILMKTKFPGS